MNHIVLRWTASLIAAVGLSATAVALAERQQKPPAQPTFGGAYSDLDARRRALIDGWVARLSKVSVQPIDAGALYDTKIRVSTKTTFEAVTHALMTTSLTDAATGERFGDALDLVERIDSVKGEVPGASGDHQFRMYAALKAGAMASLERSREFRRGVDNTVYHKGFPINYRATGGTPSIQISIARDGRNADVDVDYRGSSFPVALFNGHLTSANSDVRAGANYDRHVNRWTGFSNWWRGFLGIRLDRAPGTEKRESPLLPAAPRAGKKNIDVMAQDFLQAWLVEGNIVAAMGYVSDRAYACLAEDADDPASFDRGMAPFQLMNSLKAAKDALGSHASLEGLTAGVRLTNKDLRVVTQAHHAQFVLYAVPDNVAATFDCQRRITLGQPVRASRSYGRHFGTVFYVAGRGGALAGTGTSVALLWAQENGYWKIVSWQTEPEDEDLPGRAPTVEPSVTRVSGDPAFIKAANAAAVPPTVTTRSGSGRPLKADRRKSTIAFSGVSVNPAGVTTNSTTLTGAPSR